MVDILGNTVSFIFALGVIIFVHELGHLVVAKGFHARVLAFSLGFGKRLWGFRRGETDYRLSLIPLGGYVQLGGEDPTEVSDDPHEFLNMPRWQRILVYLAGPAMNIILAILLIAGVFMAGIEVSALPQVPPIVGALEAGSPGEAAGLEPGDEILAVDGSPVRKWDDVHFVLLTSPEREVTLEVRRGEETFAARVVPTRVPKYEFGDAGVYPQMLPRVGQVLEGSPAEAAGFETGDQLRIVAGRAIASTDEFVGHIEAHAGETVLVGVRRQGVPVELSVVPRDEDGKGRIGIDLSYFQRLGPLDALTASVQFNWRVARQTFSVIGKIMTGSLNARGALSGPIEIAAMSGAAARSGLRNLVYLMGLISVSIAILNLLPIPVLDGGQIAILLIESLRGRDLSLKSKERINQVGFVFIVLLMVVVLSFDISKNLPAGLLPGS